jgi:hypothetical protein
MAQSKGSLAQLGHEASRGALFRRQIAIVRERHPRRLPPQRIHDAGEVLPAREQVLIESDPRRMRADPFEQPRHILAPVHYWGTDSR